MDVDSGTNTSNKGSTTSSCYADPNFAVICGFFEKFGKMCGVPFPLASELVMMLECEEGVPEPLASLHVQLLRKIRRSTTVEKWERTAVKFCQTFLKDDAEELEHKGYLGCSMELKLRLLRTLLETQFDYNSKFKAAVNLLTADELRQKPIGRDLTGRIYWGLLDSSATLKVFREDPTDNNGWTVVAEDRTSLVKLLHELTGDDSLDLSPIVETPAPVVDTGQNSSSTDEEGEENGENGALSEGTTEGDDDDGGDKDSKDNHPQNGEIVDEVNEKISENQDEGCSDAITDPVLLVEGLGNGVDCETTFVCSEVVEEDVMFVHGDGYGVECDTGNPDRETGDDQEVSTSCQQPPIDHVSTSNEPGPSASVDPDCGVDMSAVADSTSASGSMNVDSTSRVIDQMIQEEAVASSSQDIIEVTASSSSSCEEVSTTRPAGFSESLDSDSVDVQVSAITTPQEDNIVGSSESPEICINQELQESIQEDNEVDSSQSHAHEYNLPTECPSVVLPDTGRPENSDNICPQIPPTDEAVPSQSKAYDDKHDNECSLDEGTSSVSASNARSEEDSLRQKLWSVNDLCASTGHDASSRIPGKVLTKFSIENVLETSYESNPCDTSPKNEPPTNSQSPEAETVNCVVSEFESQTAPDISVPLLPSVVEKKESACTGTAEDSCEFEAKTKEEWSDSLTVPAIIITPTTPDSAHSQSSDSSVSDKIQGKRDNLSSDSVCKLSELENEKETSNKSIYSTYILEGSNAPNHAALDEDKNMTTDPMKGEPEDNWKPNSNMPNSDNPQDNKEVCQQASRPDFDSSDYPTENSSVINSADNVVTNELPSEPVSVKTTSPIMRSSEESENMMYNYDTNAVKDSDVCESMITNQEAAGIAENNSDKDLYLTIPVPTPLTTDNVKSSVPECMNPLVVSTEVSSSESSAFPDQGNHPANDNSIPCLAQPSLNPPLQIEQQDTDFDSHETAAPLHICVNQLESSVNSIGEHEEALTKEEHTSIISDEQPDFIDRTSPPTETYVPVENCQSLESTETKLDEIKEEGIQPKAEAEILAEDYKNSLSTDLEVSERIEMLTVECEEQRADVTDQKVNVKSSSTLEAAKDSSIEKCTGSKQQKPVSSDSTNKSLRSSTWESDQGEVPSSAEEGRDVSMEEPTLTPLPKEEDAADEADPLATPVSPVKEEKDEGGVEFDPLALNDDNSVLPKTPSKKRKPKKRGRKFGPRKKEKVQCEKVSKQEEIDTKEGISTEKEKVVEQKTANKGTRSKSSGREVKSLGINTSLVTDDSSTTIRQSRRIAQLRMKEDAERRRREELELQSFKKTNKVTDEKSKRGSKKKNDIDFEEDEEEENDETETFRKKKKIRFDKKNPWLSSSGSSQEEEVEEEEDEIEEEAEELEYKSDHEFSPESDLDDPEYQPMRVARTAHARKDAPQGRYDDVACEFCGMSDRPEWILLCDSCDKGSHTDCLKPPLHVVPEGEWFCPPCSLQTLIEGLKKTLRDYDRLEKQRENEQLRKKRLAFVGISLDNVLPSKKPKKPEKKHYESESVSSSASSSAESSDSEPVYQLRERRTNVASYRFNEYDEMIRSAIRDELEVAPEDEELEKEAKDGLPSDNVVNNEKTVKTDKNDESGAVNKPKNPESADTDEDADDIPAVVPRKRQVKKKKKSKLTSLDLTSEEEDHNSDSDFKGSSEDEDEEDEEDLDSESELSGDRRRSRRRGGWQAVRRSARARRRRYDKDFINDESSEEDSSKSAIEFDSSEESDSDRSWGRKKSSKRSRKQRALSPIPKRKKKHKKKKKNSDESESDHKPKKRKVKFGLDLEGDGKVVNRRTRGKQINYKVDNDASDSEEEVRRRKKNDDSEESDVEFNAEDEKLEDEEDEDQEEEESVSEEEESEEDIPVRKKPKFEKPKTPRKGKKKAKQGSKKGKGRNKKNETASESGLDDDLEDLDEEAEEKLLDMLEEGDMPVEQLKAAVKRTKEESKTKTGGNEEKNKRTKVKITPTRAEIAEKAAAAKADKGGGLLMRSLQAGQGPTNPVAAPLPAARQGRPAFPSPLPVPPSLSGPRPHSEITLQQSPMPQLLPGTSRPQNSLMANPGQPPEGQTPHMIPPHHMQLPLQGAPHPQVLQSLNQQIHPHGNIGAPLHPMGPQHHPVGHPAQQLQLPSRPTGPLPPIPHPPGNSYPAGVVPQMAQLHPQMPHHSPSLGGQHAQIHQVSSAGPLPSVGQQAVLHSQMGQQPQSAPLQMGNPQGNLPMVPQYPRHLPPFPTQGSFPNSGVGPNFQTSPEHVKQRKKPGPKPGSKNKKKTEEDIQAAAAAKARTRGLKGSEVTIATVQAPTQFPDPGVADGGSVITRMLNSSPGSVPTVESGPRFSCPPVSTPSGPPLYHPGRPLDPSPSGGGAVTVSKPPFPPEAFPPYQNFQQHFPGFPSAGFPPALGQPPSAGPAVLAAAPLPNKPFEEEEPGEFGGLASYFASQAEEDLDT